MPSQRTRRWISVGAATGALALGGVLGNPAKAAEPARSDLARTVAEIAVLESKAAEVGEKGDHASAAELLGRATEKQKLVVRLDVAGNVEQNARLERLVVARDNEKAQAVAISIDRLEEQAETARKDGRTDVTIQSLREALALQRSVDDSRAVDRFKNFTREMSLAQAVQNTEAEPLARGMEEALREARAAVSAQRWTDATAAYERVRATRAKLGRDFARTSFADPATLAEIDAELTAFAPTGASAAIDEQEKEADAAAKDGRTGAAAELYAAAREAQIKLNADFAGSRFASPQRVEGLELKRQTMLAEEGLVRARALDGSAAAHLAKREVFAAELDAKAAAAVLESAEKDFPQTRERGAGLKVKLAYLGGHGAELGEMQDMIFDRLVPVPGRNDIMMLHLPVPQALYAKIMSVNPSRNRGEERLVDSVTWNDALEFCRRASWVLGRTVRLPKVSEWRMAWETGTIDPLHGGTKEWLAPEPGQSAQALAGDWTGTTPAAPQDVERSGLARQMTFRVVVEYRLE